MKKTKKVFISRDRLENALWLRKTTLRIMSDDLGNMYEVIRKSVREELIMPDTLKRIADYLNVSVEYLQNEAPLWQDFKNHHGAQVFEEMLKCWYEYVDNAGYVMQIPQTAKDEMLKAKIAEDNKELLRQYAKTHQCSLSLDDTDLSFIEIAFSKCFEEYMTKRKQVGKSGRYKLVFNSDNRALFTSIDDMKRKG